MNKLFFLIIANLLLAVTVASCHSDDPAPLDAKLIEGTFVPSPGKFLVNGEDYSDKGISLQFEPSKTKEGKIGRAHV